MSVPATPNNLLIVPETMQAALLDSVACTFVPEDMKDACDNKVEAAVKHAVQMFEDYVSPATVCKPICPDGSLLDHTFHQPRYPECSKCEFLTAELANNQEDNADGHACMCKSCKQLPDPLVEECMGFVQWHGACSTCSTAVLSQWVLVPVLSSVVRSSLAYFSPHANP